MTLERKILLSLLALMILLFLLLTVVLPVRRENRSLRERILQTELLIAVLEAEDSGEIGDPQSETDYAALYGRFSRELDLLSFGQQVKGEILRLDLTLENYQQGRLSDRDFLEYYLTGEIGGFLTLLETLYTGYPYFEILSLSIQAEKTPALFSFRIAPVAVPEGFPEPVENPKVSEPDYRNYSQPSAAVAGIFFRPFRPVRQSVQVAPVTETPESPEPDRERLQFIGTVETAEEGLRYFFKDRNTGQILKLSLTEPWRGWNLLEKKEGRFYIEKEDQLFEVNP